VGYDQGKLNPPMQSRVDLFIFSPIRIKKTQQYSDTATLSRAEMRNSLTQKK